MYIKKLKRKCGVRGCKNTETYAISKSREMGNSIIACKDCLVDALTTIEEQNKPIEEAKPVPASLIEASKHYDAELIKDATETLVEELKEKGWSFVYVGANHDVEAVASSISIKNTICFDANSEGMKKMTTCLNAYSCCMFDDIAEETKSLKYNKDGKQDGTL
jgi:hypothetical protein